MKIHIDIDCTPEEARTFFGLPDLGPMQAAVMAGVQEKMTAALEAMDPETLFRTWMPQAVSGWEQMQRAFWSGMGSSGAKDE